MVSKLFYNYQLSSINRDNYIKQNNMTPKIRELFVILTILLILSYFMFAFCFWQLNPLLWGIEGRVSFIGVWVCLIIFIPLIKDIL